MLEVNSQAPEFLAYDERGQEHSLKKYHGQWLLLYFYPRDNTPGCSKEACAFRDNYQELKKLGINILGVSANSATSHQKFIAKFLLPFSLLVDSERKIAQEYQAVDKDRRSSYLIDPSGQIVRVYKQVNPGSHPAEVLADLKNIFKL